MPCWCAIEYMTCGATAPPTWMCRSASSSGRADNGEDIASKIARRSEPPSEPGMPSDPERRFLERHAESGRCRPALRVRRVLVRDDLVIEDVAVGHAPAERDALVQVCLDARRDRDRDVGGITELFGGHVRV